MSVDRSVFQALESAVAGMPPSDPSAIPVRIHLAGLYLSGGMAELALAHSMTVLTLAPEDTSALSLAAAAAAATGKDELADSYRLLHAALLTGEALTSPPESGAPRPAESSGPERSGPERSTPEPSTPEPSTRELSTPQPSAPEPARASHPRPVDPAQRDLFGLDAEPILDSTGWDSSDPREVTLADVAGMADVKRRLQRSLLGPMANPTLSEAFGKQLRGGLLLWGPPGTGKTFIARALSGELGAHFFSATPADIYGSFFGQSEQNVARLFAEARQEAPGVVFLDELDAIGGRRSRRNTDQARAVVNQLLTELDGLASNEGVYVLAATNAPWDVDEALRRPGRFDRTILVLPPDEPARNTLLQMELRGRPVAPGIDLARLVRSTETYSGADLVRVVEAATERALERSMELGIVSPVTDADLQAAVRDTPASTRSWLSTAATYLAHVGDSEDFHELRGYLRSHKIG
ncbi:MAG TPA: AAA family ATPase [Kineosporiaceae bacterium]|nr:AAA family ATPase [Kineosporiaceae bacterium]